MVLGVRYWVNLGLEYTLESLLEELSTLENTLEDLSTLENTLEDLSTLENTYG